MESQDGIQIWPPYEILYIESLLSRTSTTILNYERLVKIVSDLKLIQQNTDLLINLAENIIKEAAAVSRYIFPIRKNPMHTTRGEKLKKSLKIGQESILNTKGVRDYLEHFDERLDKFLHDSVVGNIVPRIVVINSTELDDSTFVFRGYIINDYKFIGLKNEIRILPIMEEIYRIHNLLIEFREDGGRLK